MSGALKCCVSPTNILVKAAIASYTGCGDLRYAGILENWKVKDVKKNRLKFEYSSIARDDSLLPEGGCQVGHAVQGIRMLGARYDSLP